MICFYAEFFCFISQALALTTLLSAKLRSLGETGIKSCLKLLLGDLQFLHCGTHFQPSNTHIFQFFSKYFPIFLCKLTLSFLGIGIMTVSLNTYPIHPCLTKVTLGQQSAGYGFSYYRCCQLL